MKLIIASKNPVKAEAARKGVQMMFPDAEITVETVSVSSDVSDQPMTDHETRYGAYNRVKNAINAVTDGDLYLGIEGGCAETTDILGGEQLEGFAWTIVSNGNGQWGEARTASFHLPTAVAALVRQGVELGEADDRVFSRMNSKHGDGATGLLTGGALNRAD